jgi:PKD repeat protein
MGTQAKIIAEALKTYGVIIRDRGSYGLSLTVEEDSRIDPYGSNMSGLHDLTLYDFEFVDESSLEINSSTAQVRTSSPPVVKPVSSFTSNVTSGTPPTAVQFNETSTGSPTWGAWFFEYLNRLRLLILP